MDIKIEEIPENELKPKPTDESKLGFAQTFTDRMFFMHYKDGAWMTPEIIKYGPIALDPAAKVLHYSQEIFEGMKAYPTADGHLNLFRPEENARRFARSARRIVMPEVPEDVYVEGIKKLLEMEKEWAPKSSGSSMYIRPTMIGITPALGVNPALEFYFYIIIAPSRSYFPEGFKPIKIFVSTEHVRAVDGGTGEAKTGGNYAASLLAGKIAAEHGCGQVLWLDAIERKYVEEVGAMNMMFAYGETIYTAPLKGTILPGITRDSIIQLAKDNGYKIVEEALDINKIVADIENGTLTEAFGVGTAASVAPVGSLHYKGKEYTINNFEIGDIANKLYKALTDIQWGRVEDKYNWVVRAV